jgi:L,D-transpeptidase catalytic domain/Putative peptidoglycan binding domain
MTTPPPPPRRRPPPQRATRPAAQRGQTAARRAPSKKTEAPVGRWIPAIAALAVLAIVVAAGAGDDHKGVAGAGADAAADVNANPSADPGIIDATSTSSVISATDIANAADTGGISYEETGLTVPASTMPAIGIATGAPIVKTHISTTLRQGSYSEEVKTVQSRLTQLGFVPGVSDGAFGEQTKEAVWAYEKLILQTPPEEATGKVTDAMWQGMQDPIVIQPRRPGNGTHVEIYLPQQVAAVFKDNIATLVLHISSGTATTPERTKLNSWCETIHLDTDADGNPVDPPIAQDVCGVAYTPGGVFSFKREVTGDRVGALGRMFNPIYFNYGIAMHGAKEVPLHPASHGCIRMNQRISDTFQSYVHIHDRVYVWGWDGKEPEQYTKRESTPIFNYADPDAATTTTTEKPTTTSEKASTPTTEKPTPTTAKSVPTTTAKPTPTTATPTTPAPTTAAPTTAAPTTAAPTTAAPTTAAPPPGSGAPP